MNRMPPVDVPANGFSSSEVQSDKPSVHLLLYIARSTPNSMRAQHNLSVALEHFKDCSSRIFLKSIDVFSQPKRALTDGVIVTPTLIGRCLQKRAFLMGDLSDDSHLHALLLDLLDS